MTDNKLLSSVILVTGGVRCGKSEYAEKIILALAEECGQKPLYVATAQVTDDEMRRRVAIHKTRRTDRWDNAEEPLDPSVLDVRGRIILIDCLTLWLTNLFMECGMDFDKTILRFEESFDRMLRKSPKYLVVVTNEIGLGGIAANPVQRKFADLQGIANQRVASLADEVTMMISGIPLKVK